MTHQTILIVHPERGRITERTLEKITLEELQRAVGGYIEHVPVEGLTEEGIVMLANKDGLLAGLPVNKNLLPFFFVGDIVFCKLETNGHGKLEFVGLDEYQRQWLTRLSYIDTNDVPFLKDALQRYIEALGRASRPH